mmetsp:Transcript_15109/g.27897  ORF Transcript_15109/g.27897 Transcript_15109/m.27897 type:complete len:424 (-) Transcript_15109:167-1438(-)
MQLLFLLRGFFANRVVLPDPETHTEMSTYRTPSPCFKWNISGDTLLSAHARVLAAYPELDPGSVAFRRILFLYSKLGEYAKHTSEFDEFCSLCDSLANPGLESTVKTKAASVRLASLVSKSGNESESGDTTLPGLDNQEFPRVLQLFKGEWSAAEEAARKGKHAGNCVMAISGSNHPQRVQTDGLCYMSASIVMQSILVRKTVGQAGKEQQSVDARKFIAFNFSEFALFNHIFSGRGGSSLGIFKSITTPTFGVPYNAMQHINIYDSLQGKVRSSYKRWRKLLIDFGPGLVSNFEVHADLKEEQKFSYAGPPKGAVLGLHAMVLVGVRLEVPPKKAWLTNHFRLRVAPLKVQKKQEKKLYFLVQNWTATKQFIEMDAEYFLACEPFVTFVKTPQTSIPSRFDKTSDRFLESSDLGETGMYEDI